MDFTSLFGSAGESSALNSSISSGLDGTQSFMKGLQGLASGNSASGGAGWGNSATTGATMSAIDGIGKAVGSLIALAFM